MDENSWIFDVLDPKLIGEIGPKRGFELFSDAIRNKLKDENEKNLLKCALCPNMCEFSCPVLRTGGRETTSPARKSKLGFLYSKEKLKADELGENPYYCLSCSACEQNCPMDLPVSDMLVPVRKDMGEEGAIPEGVEEIGKKLEKNQIIYDKIESSEKDENDEGEILYFRGCVARKELPEVVESTMNILEKLSGDFRTLDEEVCCGRPALSLGYEETFSEIARNIVEALEQSGVEKVVCTCPTCAQTLREIYPENGYDIGPSVFHISEYLAKNIGEEEMELNEPLKSTYHDPCTLARDLGVIKEPRELLEKIKNLDFEDPYFSEEDTRCCGRGGPLKYVDEGLSEEIAKKRINHLEDWSDTIITSCPSCKVSFESVGHEEVYDLSEILSKVL